MAARRNVVSTARAAVLILVIAAGLALAIEFVVRAVVRCTSGSWPTTRDAAFDSEIRRALRLYRRHPFLNTAPAEGVAANAFGKSASFSSQGYRSPERSAQKPEGVQRIVCSGGSTTFDILASEDSATWPWKMERTLRRKGLHVEVFNAGFPGWTSLENLVSLAIRDLDLQPDVVVFYQGLNDLQPASHRPFDPQYEHGHVEPAVRALGFGLAPLPWYERSVVVERCRDFLVGVDDPWHRLQGPSPTTAELTEIPARAVKTFDRNVRAFISIASSGGADVVLVTQPLHVRPSSAVSDHAYLAQWIEGLEPAAVPSQLSRLNAVLRKIGRDQSVVLVDAAADVGWEDGDFADPMHFSARGSERMARFMAESLETVLSGSPLDGTH